MRKAVFIAGLFFVCVSAVPALAEEAVNAAVPEIINADLENQEIVNDEGYGAEDTEYYGSDEEANIQDNSEEETPDVAVNGTAK